MFWYAKKQKTNENLILYIFGCYWKLNFYPKILPFHIYSRSYIIILCILTPLSFTYTRNTAPPTYNPTIRSRPLSASVNDKRGSAKSSSVHRRSSESASSTTLTTRNLRVLDSIERDGYDSFDSFESDWCFIVFETQSEL